MRGGKKRETGKNRERGREVEKNFADASRNTSTKNFFSTCLSGFERRQS
jgi:hypothetical protein